MRPLAGSAMEDGLIARSALCGPTALPVQFTYSE